MAREAKRVARSENLSLRLDPKTKFVIEFMARLKGQSMTTVIERAILEAAENAKVDDEPSWPKTWQEYWHVVEGVRTLKVISDRKLFPTFDEDYLHRFVSVHWPFFFGEFQMKTPLVWAFEVLWPVKDTFLEIWERTQTTDYFAAGKAMQVALRKAGLYAPEWPAKKPAPPPPPSEGGGHGKQSSDRPADNLDDEIPF